MSIHRKKRRKPQNIVTWIRQRTSPFDYGIKTSVKPVHCNKNADVLMHFQALRAGRWSSRLSRFKNADMADHFAGTKTYYFTADGGSSVPEVLVNIDIDCHHSGSLAGALAFAAHLRATRFRDLYFEVSTNGNGVHGYIVVEKGDLGDEGLNSTLKRLDRWLKHELSRGNWDVEDVEVKGHAPEFTWGDSKFELKTYKSGQLAKLPREALARADELRGTTRIDVDALRRLKLSSDDGDAGEPVLRKHRPRGSQIAFETTRTKQTGSVSGRHFGPEELDRLRTEYLEIATDLLGDTRLVATGRKVVTVEDLAIFLMLLRFFTDNMNPDGSLPTERWKGMWKALYEAGDVDRAWCHHRFATIRNFLSEKDLLFWEDEGFVIGAEVHGRYVPGKAAKWRASEILMARLEAGAQVSGEGGRGESILYGCIVSPLPSGTSETIEYFSDFDQDGHEQAGREGESILYGNTLSPSLGVQATKQSHNVEPAFMIRLRAEIPPLRPQFLGYSWQREGMRMAA